MIEMLKKTISQYGDRCLLVYLFGSSVLESIPEGNDIDIAVLAAPDQDLFELKMDLYLLLSRELKRNDVDIVIMNKCRNLVLLNRIINHGKLLYESDAGMRMDYEQRISHLAIDFLTQRKMAMGI